MEHVLSSSVTDSVCSFLGHPKFCPHGKPIPAGECCRSFSNAVEPLVQPLGQLAVGRLARIVYMVPSDPARLVKLSDLGLVPGTRIRLQQRRPATVVAIGETTLALDREIVSEIYVKKVDEPEGG
jgi:DtxR family Mn-dependent transcriptional regulator